MKYLISSAYYSEYELTIHLYTQTKELIYLREGERFIKIYSEENETDSFNMYLSLQIYSNSYEITRECWHDKNYVALRHIFDAFKYYENEKDMYFIHLNSIIQEWDEIREEITYMSLKWKNDEYISSYEIDKLVFPFIQKCVIISVSIMREEGIE
jgi:hypothetical protein